MSEWIYFCSLFLLRNYYILGIVVIFRDIIGKGKGLMVRVIEIIGFCLMEEIEE